MRSWIVEGLQLERSKDWNPSNSDLYCFGYIGFVSRIYICSKLLPSDQVELMNVRSYRIDRPCFITIKSRDRL